MATVFDDEQFADLNLEFDASDVSEDSLWTGGMVSKPGFYHVSGGNVSMEKGDDNSLKHLQLEMIVLDGTEESEINKRLYHRIYLEGWEKRPEGDEPGVKKGLDKKQQQGIIAFAFAFGLVSKDAFGKQMKVPFHMFEGSQAVVKVSEDEYFDRNGQKKKSFKMAWNNDCWPVWHDRVRDVPKDAESLAMLGGIGGSGGDQTDISDL